MATKKAPQREQQQDVVIAADLIDPREREPLDEQLARLAAELGAEEKQLTVKVYRLERQGTRERRVFCDAYTMQDIDNEAAFQRRIRADWGGGTYVLQAHKGAHYVLNRTIDIAEGNPATRAPAAADPLELARQQQDAELRLLEKMKIYKELFAPANGAGQAGGMQAFMQGVEFARGAGRSTSPGEQLRDMLEMIEGARTLREKIDAPTNAEPSLAVLGVEALKTISGLIKGEAAPAPGAPLPTVAIPQQLADSTQPQGQPVDALRESINYLNQFARMNASPAPVAELVYEQSPDEVLAFLKRPDWFEQLCATAPEVRPFEKWYRATHAELLQLMTEPEPAGKPAVR